MHKVGPGLLALRIEYSLRDSHRAPSVTLDGPSSPLATTRSFKDMTGLAALRTYPVRQFIDMHGQLMTLTVAYPRPSTCRSYRIGNRGRL